jgi:hypothetical protein
MDEIFEPISFIFENLNEIDFSTLGDGIEVFVSLDRPKVIARFPSITFSVGLNVPNYDLDNEIRGQNIDINLDIWTEESPQAGKILKLVEKKLRTLGYQCTFNRDILDPSGKFHLTTVFTY